MLNKKPSSFASSHETTLQPRFGNLHPYPSLPTTLTTSSPHHHITSVQKMRICLSSSLKYSTFLTPRSLHISNPIFNTCRKMSTSQAQPNFSSNYDPEQGTKDLETILKGKGGKWELMGSGKGVERSFKFKTFKKTWVRFVSGAAVGGRRRHHWHGGE